MRRNSQMLLSGLLFTNGIFVNTCKANSRPIAKMKTCKANSRPIAKMTCKANSRPIAKMKTCKANSRPIAKMKTCKANSRPIAKMKTCKANSRPIAKMKTCKTRQEACGEDDAAHAQYCKWPILVCTALLSTSSLLYLRLPVRIYCSSNSHLIAVALFWQTTVDSKCNG